MTTSKPESEWKLEDWFVHYTSYCTCHATYKCAGCTMKELDALRNQATIDIAASWRKTLEAERSSYKALNERFARCQKALNDAHRAT